HILFAYSYPPAPAGHPLAAGPHPAPLIGGVRARALAERSRISRYLPAAHGQICRAPRSAQRPLADGPLLPG
nr:hypothetical protein [Tanacetum cinerariifolium]